MGCCGETNSNTCSNDPCETQDQTKATPLLEGFPELNIFNDNVQNCYDYMTAEREKGRPLVGISCEYTPREIIMAAGAMPVCLCGGSQETIPAAEEDLPANLCPLIKSTYGYSLMETNPFMNLADLIVAETTCDGKKKMYELLERRHPMHVLEFPQKSNDPDALNHWKAELKKLASLLEEKFNVTITEEKLREAVKLMNRERQLRRKLASFSAMENPPISGRELLQLKSLISGIPADIEAYEKGIEALENACPSQGKEGVRVLLTGVPVPHGAERVINIIEENGGVIVAQENCTGLKPIWEDVDESADDIYEALAKKYFNVPCSVLTTNEGRLDLIRELSGIYKPDVVVDLSWQACLTYDIESKIVKEFVEDELDLSYLRISTDYSPNDSARIALRVKALFETIACEIVL